MFPSWASRFCPCNSLSTTAANRIACEEPNECPTRTFLLPLKRWYTSSKSSKCASVLYALGGTFSGLGLSPQP